MKNLTSLSAADLDLVSGGCGKPVVKPEIKDCSVTKPTYDGKLVDEKIVDEKIVDEKLAAYDGCKS